VGDGAARPKTLAEHQAVMAAEVRADMSGWPPLRVLLAPVESVVADPVVSVGPVDVTAPAAGDLAGALGIVTSLLTMLGQAEPAVPPSRALMTHYLTRVAVALARVEGERGAGPAVNGRPVRRVPGQVRHGELQDGGVLS
jgi:hypothetical protein